MAQQDPRTYSASDRLRWAALALVFGAAMINYIDRQAIALLKPTVDRLKSLTKAILPRRLLCRCPRVVEPLRAWGRSLPLIR